MLVSEDGDHKSNFNRTKNLASDLYSVPTTEVRYKNYGPCLLNFYAAESGLKYLLNRKERVPFEYQVKNGAAVADSANSFPAHIERYLHDLPRMLTRLKVPPHRINIPNGPFKTVGGYQGGQDFEIKSAHEAWRYGLETDPAHQVILEKFLEDVISYIEGEL